MHCCFVVSDGRGVGWLRVSDGYDMRIGYLEVIELVLARLERWRCCCDLIFGIIILKLTRSIKLPCSATLLADCGVKWLDHYVSWESIRIADLGGLGKIL